MRIRLSSIALLVLLSACGSPPGDLPRIAALFRPDTFATEPLPATFDQALDALDRGLSGRDFRAMQVLGEDEAVAAFYRMLHGREHGWQVPWNLSSDGSLRRELSRAGFRHPGDMSEAILRSFWRRLHGRPVDLAGQVREANTVREAARVAPQWVVFPEQLAGSLVQQCGRQVPSSDGSWLPDTATIRQLEEVLPDALQDALGRKTPARSARFKPSDYYRQYGGLVVDEKRIVYVNGFHRESLALLVEFPRRAMFWRTSPVVVCDGGQWFFGAEYDPSIGRVRSIAFN